MVTIIILSSVTLLIGGYIFYGNRLERWLAVDPERPTPACTMGDRRD